MSKADKSWSKSADSNGTGKQTLDIPSNARDIKMTVTGSRGGSGGYDSDDQGGDGGTGRKGDFEFKSAYDFKGFKLEVWMGKKGGDGEDEKTGSGGGSAGDSGQAPGGKGGDTAPYPYSGGGGGGGGATVVKYSDPDTNSRIIVCAGGGGGAGGASRNRPGDDGKNAPSFSADNSISVSSGGAGQTQDKCNGDPNDGGGGGGGGGGAGGGGGGLGGSDDNFCSQRSKGGEGGGSEYSSTYLSKKSDESTDDSGEIEVEWEEITPEISTWKSDPENQYSVLGTPMYSHTLEWSGKDYDWAGYKKVEIDGQAVTRAYTETTNTTSIDIDNLSQTNADTNSPRKTKWLLTLCIGGKDGQCVDKKITVKHKNDNKPSNTWTTKFTGLEPNTTVIKKIGTLDGVDMPTIITTDTNGVTFSQYSTDIGGDFDVSYTFENGNNVYIRATTANWNTDVSGLSSTDEYGKTNSIFLNVQPGGKTAFNVEFETKAPKIKETFNYGNVTGKYPHPDIDLINNSPSNEMVTNEVTINDLDIPRPFRSSNNKIKISINNGNWKNVENLNPKRV